RSLPLSKESLPPAQAHYFRWCGGWDSNPRRPSPQGPKPEAGAFQLPTAHLTWLWYPRVYALDRHSRLEISPAMTSIFLAWVRFSIFKPRSGNRVFSEEKKIDNLRNRRQGNYQMEPSLA